jgi:hypothetical protein
VHVADANVVAAAACRPVGERRLAVLLLVALVCYAPFIRFGYGAADDSWRIAEAGRRFMATGVYTPSRYPGFPVHEIPAALLAHVGGALLSNAGSLAMALLGVYAFTRVAAHFGLRHRFLLALSFATNPVYWTSATYTIDYVWSLALLLSGFALALERRYLWAGVVLGLATGSRLSSFAFALTLLGYQALRARADRRSIAGAAALAACIGALGYVSTLQRYGLLRLHFGDWDRFDYLANFAYGNIMLVGPQSLIALGLALSTIVIRGSRLFPPEWRSLAGFCAIIIAGYEALFLFMPIQVGYLLPALPCLLLVLGIVWRDRPKLLVLWLCTSASASLLTVNPIHVSGGAHYVESALPPLFERGGPGVRGRTTVVRAGLFVRRGYLVSDVAARGSRLRALSVDVH